MKFIGYQVDVQLVPARWWVGMWAGISISVAAWGAGAADSREDLDLFEGTNVLTLAIEIPEPGLQTLRRARPNQREKPKATATVTEDGRTYTNVSVQLKGFTSFQSIDERPGLTLNFDRLGSGQRFHGLAKLSLNNSMQDGTRLNEKFARELFAAAGVPVPRADFARVTLNGRDLGLRVVTEGFDKAFLRRHFKRTDGTLYQGGVLQDIDRPLDVNVEGKVAGEDAVRRLLAAAREPDASRRWRALEASLEVDRFLSMQAMETILCHSDSYSMNRNNYRVYHNPETDKLVFMPHGMDRVMGDHRSNLDLNVVPPVLGLVSRALLSTTEGRRRHVERLADLVTNVFDPDHLCARVHEIDARISGHGADMFCDKIRARAADLKLQLTDWSEHLSPPTLVQFEEEPEARLPDWRLRPRAGQAAMTMERQPKDGRSWWKLQSAQAPLAASLHVRLRLPAGRYRLEGRWMVEGGDEAGPKIRLEMVRSSTSRFGYVHRMLDWRGVNLAFEVSATQAPEEIEFTCDLRDGQAEVRIDPSALRLVRE